MIKELDNIKISPRMKLVDINISNLGLIKGRDALNILEIKSINPRKVEIIVSLFVNGSTQKFLKIMFNGVILFKIVDENIRGTLTEEEFEMYADSNTESVFMEIENSSLAKKNQVIYRNAILRHIILETYDFNVESLCESIIVEELFNIS